MQALRNLTPNLEISTQKDAVLLILFASLVICTESEVEHVRFRKSVRREYTTVSVKYFVLVLEFECDRSSQLHPQQYQLRLLLNNMPIPSSSL